MKTFALWSIISTAFGATIKSNAGAQDDSVWQPEVGAKIQMMISAVPKVDRSLAPQGVNIFDVDMFEAPASTISALKNKGIKVICYFSAGTGEDWRPDYSQFKSSDLGAGLPDWQGEKYLNLRSENVLKVMKARIQKAADLGCDGIDPDNMGTQNLPSLDLNINLTVKSRCILQRRRRIQFTIDPRRLRCFC
jgi:hypothetical protein